MEETKKNAPAANSYGSLLARMNNIIVAYGGNLSADSMASAFARAGLGLANMPQLQNRRVKAISSLPADFTKEEIGAFLRAPYGNERALRQTSEILKWTAYPYYKITKAYQDIPTYRYYAKPLYIDAEKAKSEGFIREARLIDKLNKALRPDVQAHRIAGQAITEGKVFYILRTSTDKIHNKVNYAFMQQLPQDWCTIIGFNNISGYTISFNMMYFMQIGTDVTQFGDLFEPYLDDFGRMFTEPENAGRRGKFVYASVPCKNGKIPFYPHNVNRNAAGNPKVFMQNGTWAYYVSLPIDRVWTFEIDDTTSAVIPPLAGLMLTYAQQSDYEAAQLSLLLNPLIKIFTGEMPYYSDDGSKTDDAYRLSLGGRAMFEQFFNTLMLMNNTGGSAFYMAPVENIKSHDFAESANANNISSSFNKYGMAKAGLSGVIPVDDDVKAGQAELSAKLESRYSEQIYRGFERMMNYLYSSLNLTCEWDFHMFGSIYTDDETRKNAQAAIANGDISAHYILAALDGQSITDKISMMNVVKESGILDMLIPPVTSYTMKQEQNGGLPPQAGRPQNEKVTEGNEKSIDAAG